MKSIPVSFIRFENNTTEVPGGMSSSITTCFDKEHGDRKRHSITYDPWVRMFWIEYYDRPVSHSDSSVVEAAYIPAEKAMYWKPAHGRIVPKVESDKPKRR